MAIDISEGHLKHDVLGLVLALVEIIRDALRIQALKRMESGALTEEECERLGKALMDLDNALEEIKEEQGVVESVQAVRDGLDDLVDDVLDRIINPQRWGDDPGSRGLPGNQPDGWSAADGRRPGSKETATTRQEVSCDSPKTGDRIHPTSACLPTRSTFRECKSMHRGVGGHLDS